MEAAQQQVPGGGGGGGLWGAAAPPSGGFAAVEAGLLDAPFSGCWPTPHPAPPPPLSGAAFLGCPCPQGNFEIFHQQDLALLTGQVVHSKCSILSQAENPSFIPLVTSALTSQHANSVSMTTLQEMPSFPLQVSSVNSESICALQGLPSSPITLDRPADDGYNWRKYGQKAVKGGEYPKSYYKCTHQNCLVRKNVEHSADGRIVQIIYRGQHTHERPSKRRSKNCGGLSDDLDDYHGNTDASIRSQSDCQDYCRKPIISDGSMVGHLVKKMEDGDEQLSGSSDSEERHYEVRTDDGAAGNAGANERNVPSPGQKIIVSTTSEVDLLDDGYRWRKYGQKVVKGNPYPRSYYKCTYLGCDVKKQVERSVEEPNSVITTYEGKHIHDVPAARKRSHTVVNSSLLENAESNTYCTGQAYRTIMC